MPPFALRQAAARTRFDMSRHTTTWVRLRVETSIRHLVFLLYWFDVTNYLFFPIRLIMDYRMVPQFQLC